jgi:hypothetical protein
MVVLRRSRFTDDRAHQVALAGGTSAGDYTGGEVGANCGFRRPFPEAGPTVVA